MMRDIIWMTVDTNGVKLNFLRRNEDEDEIFFNHDYKLCDSFGANKPVQCIFAWKQTHDRGDCFSFIYLWFGKWSRY